MLNFILSTIYYLEKCDLILSIYQIKFVISIEIIKFNLTFMCLSSLFYDVYQILHTWTNPVRSLKHY